MTLLERLDAVIAQQDAVLRGLAHRSFGSTESSYLGQQFAEATEAWRAELRDIRAEIEKEQKCEECGAPLKLMCSKDVEEGKQRLHDMAKACQGHIDHGKSLQAQIDKQREAVRKVAEEMDASQRVPPVPFEQGRDAWVGIQLWANRLREAIGDGG